jgi:peroxiredoxin
MLDNSTATPDWSSLPAPIDDGACDHLTGMTLPEVKLAATEGPAVNLAALPGRSVVYAYPRTGQPGLPNPPGWDLIPGARGCSPQSCAFRDHFQELKALGVARVFGVSTQSTEYQREAAQRLHLPFPLLSDAAGALTAALRLPTFEVAGMRLLKRVTLVIDDGRISRVFYPVFPPDKNAETLLAWLKPPPATGHPPQALLELIANSFKRLTGQPLLPPGAPIREAMWHANAVIVAHDTQADPVFFYGNRAALDVFEYAFEDFTRLPSRLSAEPLERAARARLLDRVRREGFINDYSGVRISSSGRRFEITNAVVWNLIDHAGRIHGQAATFSSWR